MNKENKGIWIPIEILELKGTDKVKLELTDKVLLSIYKYYTIEGDSHCCLLTNEKIADMLGISIPTVQRSKRKLKQLDLIYTNGGIKTWYKGCQIDTHNNSDDNIEGCQIDTPKGVKLIGQGYQNDTHNKEYNKENNKEYIIDNTGIDKEKNYFNVHRMQLEYLLENVDDELEVLEFLTDNPSIENYDLIRKKWSDNNTLIQELDRLWSNIKSK